MALTSPSTVPRLRMLKLGCAAALVSVVLIPGATQPAHATQRGVSGAKPSASATLEQCVTAVNQTERSATFAGEMTAIAGSARMEMRIDVLERMPEEIRFHAVSAPGLGVWRSSSQGVRVYKYLKQVTNLSAPAFYRGAVRFRWLNARGRLTKAVELRTARCQQPATPAPLAPPAIASTP
jgi:hypothetical protein